MKIKTIKNRYRRDFDADMECEHCGHVNKDVSCYDDEHFHRVVIPNMTCGKCGKKAPEDYKPQATKYPDGMQV